LSLFDLLYSVLLFILSPFLAVKLLLDPRFRSDFAARFYLETSLPLDVPNHTEPIWVHAASIGEIRLAIKLIHGWKAVDQDISFLITTNTLQSRDLGRQETSVPVLVAPFDLSPVVSHFIRHTQPAHLILIETEIWPNMIRLMSRRGNVTIVNGRLSDRYIKRYMLAKYLFFRTFSRVDKVLARDQISQERFQNLGMPTEKVICQGNLKFELPPIPEEPSILAAKSDIPPGKKPFLFVAGSIQPEELHDLLPAWRSICSELPEFLMIIIPRHLNKKEEIADILSQYNAGFSFASDGGTVSEQQDGHHIYVIDRMGVLKIWYYLADVIFVGGSLCDRGGQNMVEAVGYQKPVCIGPHATNFKDEVELLSRANGLKIVHNSNELAEFIYLCHNRPEAALEMGKNGFSAIEKQAHALEDNIRLLTEIFSKQ